MIIWLRESIFIMNENIVKKLFVFIIYEHQICIILFPDLSDIINKPSTHKLNV